VGTSSPFLTSDRILRAVLRLGRLNKQSEVLDMRLFQ